MSPCEPLLVRPCERTVSRVSLRAETAARQVEVGDESEVQHLENSQRGLFTPGHSDRVLSVWGEPCFECVG